MIKTLAIGIWIFVFYPTKPDVCVYLYQLFVDMDPILPRPPCFLSRSGSGISPRPLFRMQIYRVSKIGRVNNLMFHHIDCTLILAVLCGYNRLDEAGLEIECLVLDELCLGDIRKQDDQD